MNTIKIRNVKREDIEVIKNIITKTWGFDRIIRNNINLQAMLTVYINKIFQGCSFGKVATLNEEVIGLILGKIKGEPFEFEHIISDEGEANAILAKADEHDSTNIKEFTEKFRETYNSLINGKEDNYGGYLAFFVVSEKARGLKIGKKLLKELEDYFNTKSVKNYFLFTDTNCNYGFYDHNGFNRKKEKDVTFNFYDKSYDVKMFLYDYNIN